MRLSTTSNMRTREHTIPILIKFLKPVFGFNSSHISISGGQLQRQVISCSQTQAYMCLCICICMFIHKHLLVYAGVSIDQNNWNF